MALGRKVHYAVGAETGYRIVHGRAITDIGLEKAVIGLALDRLSVSLATGIGRASMVRTSMPFSITK